MLLVLIHIDGPNPGVQIPVQINMDFPGDFHDFRQKYDQCSVLGFGTRVQFGTRTNKHSRFGTFTNKHSRFGTRRPTSLHYSCMVYSGVY